MKIEWKNVGGWSQATKSTLNFITKSFLNLRAYMQPGPVPWIGQGGIQKARHNNSDKSSLYTAISLEVVPFRYMVFFPR